MSNSESLSANGDNFVTRFGTPYQSVPSGVVASVLSLSTNLWATLLVGYKAWYAVSVQYDIRCGILSSGSREDVSADTW